MKAFSFTAFISILLLTGCSDPEGTIEIRGKVVDESTKAVLPQREVIIKALIKSDDNVLTANAGQFESDSSGRFSYTLKRVKGSYLYNFYLVGDSAYAFSNNLLGITELKKYGKFLTFSLKRLTDFTITLERKSRTPASDTMFVTWESDKTDGRTLYPYKIVNYGVAPEQGYIWIGGNIKSAIKTKVFADKNAIVTFKLYRSGKRNEIIDTIFCRRDVSNYANFKY